MSLLVHDKCMAGVKCRPLGHEPRFAFKHRFIRRFPRFRRAGVSRAECHEDFPSLSWLICNHDLCCMRSGFVVQVPHDIMRIGVKVDFPPLDSSWPGLTMTNWTAESQCQR